MITAGDTVLHLNIIVVNKLHGSYIMVNMHDHTYAAWFRSNNIYSTNKPIFHQSLEFCEHGITRQWGTYLCMYIQPIQCTCTWKLSNHGVTSYILSDMNSS